MQLKPHTETSADRQNVWIAQADIAACRSGRLASTSSSRSGYFTTLRTRVSIPEARTLAKARRSDRHLGISSATATTSPRERGLRFVSQHPDQDGLYAWCRWYVPMWAEARLDHPLVANWSGACFRSRARPRDRDTTFWTPSMGARRAITASIPRRKLRAGSKKQVWWTSSGRANGSPVCVAAARKD